MAESKKVAFVGRECVACGNCTKYCRINAIKIHKGVIAVVDTEKCVGCGKCAKVCPADVILTMERAEAAI